jgi:hypothetical protein
MTELFLGQNVVPRTLEKTLPVLITVTVVIKMRDHLWIMHSEKLK